ncbi:hypothetical protein Nepgr_005460 [Nepenthes gracilis]|uniref:Uncharacterized protein n=1 Tax=Nepenthes gracilis TaxID=150966 RepID=A0AAD3S3J8_NEPGR|nr:hypothetical protein Nepgr_005460 [Nepenthes gracilis]
MALLQIHPQNAGEATIDWWGGSKALQRFLPELLDGKINFQGTAGITFPRANFRDFHPITIKMTEFAAMHANKENH